IKGYARAFHNAFDVPGPARHRHRESIGSYALVDMICRNHAACPFHVLDDYIRPAWNEANEMTGDEPRVAVDTAAGRKTHNQNERLALVEIGRAGAAQRKGRDRKRQRARTEAREQSPA